MGWSWSFIPQRLFAEPSFLELDVIDRGVLLAAYARCDKFGRGPAHPVALRACLSILDGHDVRSSFDRLALAGLLRIYVVGGRECWQLDQYDADSPAELLRRRGTASQFPPPPGDPPRSPAPAPTSTPPTPAPPDVAELLPSNTKDAPGDVAPMHATVTPPSGNVQQSSDERQASSGNVARRRDETRQRLDRSSQEGGSVAPRAPTSAPAHTPARPRTRARDEPPPPEQARPAAPASRLDPDLDPGPEPPSVVHAVMRATGDGLVSLHVVRPDPAPSPTAPPTWPPGTEEAAARWWARLEEQRPGPFGSGGYSQADLLRIAVAHPDTFGAAVDEHVSSARGWKRTDPFAWLARQCVFAAERLADERARGKRPRPSDGDEVPAVKRPHEPFAGWNWRWDSPSPDTPGLDPAWPSALDLPAEQHEALAWCTHTPDGPVSPPRRLADVPGAVDAYRHAHATEAA